MHLKAFLWCLSFYRSWQGVFLFKPRVRVTVTRPFLLQSGPQEQVTCSEVYLRAVANFAKGNAKKHEICDTEKAKFVTSLSDTYVYRFHNMI